MIKKQRYKPFYKKIRRIFEDVQSREKRIVKFRKEKWEEFKSFLEKKKIYRKLHTLFNHSGRTIGPMFFYRNKKIVKRYKVSMIAAQKLNLFYGGLRKKHFKILLLKRLRKLKPIKSNFFDRKTFNFIGHMEKKLEVVLYRAFFTKSIKSGRQLIKHGHVYVNKRLVTYGSYLLNPKDLVEIDFQYHQRIIENIEDSRFWPAQFPHLLVNYRILQILYVSRPKNDSFANLFPFRLNIKHVMWFYRYN